MPLAPPLPPGPPPPSFKSFHPPSRSDFSFENSGAVPRYPQDNRVVDSYRPAPPSRPRRPINRADSNVHRGTRQYPHGRRIDDSRYPNRQRYRRPPKPPTASRPLLIQTHREDDGAEMQMLGVSDGATKYMHDNEVNLSDNESVSDEVANEVDEAATCDGDGAAPRTNGQSLDNTPNLMGDEEPARKKLKTASSASETAAPSRPQWSNPDPYSVLPPTEDLQGKRTDPVETIRKYRRVTAESTTEAGVVLPVNAVAANHDFISFDMDDGEVGSSDSSSEEEGEDRGRQNQGSNKAFPRPNEYSREHSPRRYPSASTEQLSHGNGGTNRKRKYDEEQISHPVSRRPDNGAQVGFRTDPSVVDEWQARGRTNPVPWLRSSQARNGPAGFRLHREICDFYAFVRPQEFEATIRHELLDRFRQAVQREISGAEVHCFGSFAAELYLPTADMDVVVTSREFQTSRRKVICQSRNSLHRFADFVHRSGLARRNSVECVPWAKVPIIKFVDNLTSIHVDISFENDSGVVTNDTFQNWKRQFPAIPVLVTVVKQFLKMRGLGEVQKGGLGGFSVTCLVASLMQNLPRVKSGEIVPDQHLGEMLIEFLDLYGNQFDLSRVGINMNPPGYFNKHNYNRGKRGYNSRPSESDRLLLIDPNEPDNDISGGSRLIGFIFNHFSRARRETHDAMQAAAPSLLDWLLGGDYDHFITQRERLRRIYNDRFISTPHLKIPPFDWKKIDESAVPIVPIELSTDKSSSANSQEDDSSEEEYEPPEVEQKLVDKRVDTVSHASPSNSLGTAPAQEAGTDKLQKPVPKAKRSSKKTSAKARTKLPSNRPSGSTIPAPVDTTVLSPSPSNPAPAPATTQVQALNQPERLSKPTPSTGAAVPTLPTEPKTTAPGGNAAADRENGLAEASRSSELRRLFPEHVAKIPPFLSRAEFRTLSATLRSSAAQGS